MNNIEPEHYKKGKIAPIDYIEDQKLNFCLGNCVKYISRADHKGKTNEDLQKAHWYLTRELKTRGIKTTEGKEYEDKFEEFSEFLENIHEHDINSYEEKIGKLEQMEKKLRDELSGLYRKNEELTKSVSQLQKSLITSYNKNINFW